jgi:hypothetical protein
MSSRDLSFSIRPVWLADPALEHLAGADVNSRPDLAAAIGRGSW